MGGILYDSLMKLSGLCAADLSLHGIDCLRSKQVFMVYFKDQCLFNLAENAKFICLDILVLIKSVTFF